MRLTEPKPCAFCGAPANAFHHLDPRGMGGRGKKADYDGDGVWVCGRDNQAGCHGLLHHSDIKAERYDDGTLRYRVNDRGARALHRRRVSCKPGFLHVAIFEHKDFDPA